MPENKSRKFIYHFFSKLFIISLFVFLLGAYLKTYAIVSPYQPGAMLDPGCAPTEDNCFVQIIPDQTGNSGKFLTTNGSVTSWGTVSGGSLIGSTSTLGTETWLGTSVVGLGTASTDHTVFLGVDAGKNATTATQSNFFGYSAGQGATGAHDSNFSGYHAGINATGAYQSNFSGYNAGAAATSAHDSNFLGASAGQSASSATNSNFLGNGAGFSASGAASSNFFGSAAGLSATGAYQSNFSGYESGYQATDAHDSNFSGYQSGYQASFANTSNFFGYRAGYQATSVNNANFFGTNAGYGASAANAAIFIGNQAGYNATVAAGSIFMGNSAGNAATNAGASVFIGSTAGLNATNAPSSNFIGNGAGGAATNASDSNFIGDNAGSNATNATSSNFMGLFAGTFATNAQASNFFGTNAGRSAPNASNSIFIGGNAGYTDTVNNTGAGNKFSILIGNYTNTGGFSNSIAIGQAVQNNAANQFNIGNVLYGLGITSGTTTSTFVPSGTGKVGIANNNPGELLTLGTTGSRLGVISFAGSTSGKVVVQPAVAAGSWTLTLPTTGGTNGYVLSTDGNGVTSWVVDNTGGASLTGSTGSLGTETWLGVGATGGGGLSSINTVFIGSGAGGGTTGLNNIFIGANAGVSNGGSANIFLGTNSGDSSGSLTSSIIIGDTAGANISSSTSGIIFMGPNAGTNSTDPSSSIFIGASAGYTSVNSQSSIFIGNNSGENATALGSTFIGGSTGKNSLAANAVFIGSGAGFNTVSSNASNSVFIGASAGYGATQAGNSIFIGPQVGTTVFGAGAETAANSIFIGDHAGSGDGAFTPDQVNNTGDPNDYSILIGNYSGTNGYSNSIALGQYATNTATNQFMVGSSTRAIEEVVVTGSGGQSCTIRPDTAGINCSSDENLKTNIADLESTLEQLKNVRTVMYNWKNTPDSNAQIGFIAQNLQEYFPTLVSTASNGYLQVNYAGMTPILVNALKELNLKVEGLSSLDTTDANSLGSLIKNFLGSVGNSIDIVFFGEVHTKKLCLEDICVTKDQLEQLLNTIHSGGGDGGGPIDLPPAPTDACLNIDGVQETIPTGYHLDETSNCVADENPDPTPDPTPVPDPTGDTGDNSQPPQDTTPTP